MGREGNGGVEVRGNLAGKSGRGGGEIGEEDGGRGGWWGEGDGGGKRGV